MSDAAGTIVPGPGRPVGGRTPLRIVVRRAVPGDGDAVLSFARATFDGWDYIPSVWAHWLVASDGVLLVATPRAPDVDGVLDLDLFGRPLTPDRPIAMGRVAMLSPDEAWLEGLRVDPGVRRRSVATSVHLAAIEWARAQGAAVVRYATGDGNAGSHRIGEQNGFALLGAWRTFGISAPGDPELVDAADPIAFAGVGAVGLASSGSDDPAQSGGGFSAAGWAAGLDAPDESDGAEGRERFVPDFPGVEDDAGGRQVQAAQAATRTAVHLALRGTGLLLAAETAASALDGWWRAIAADGSFRRAGGLYEARPWRFQVLTRERFGAHVRAGEVLASGDPRGTWGAIILGTNEYGRPGEHLEAGLAAGHGDALLGIATTVERVLGIPLSLRLPDASGLLAGHEDAFAAAGFRWDDEALHVLGRTLEPEVPPGAPGPPDTLTFAEKPHRVTVPRSIGD